MTKQLDDIFIVTVDFNQTDLRRVLPKFHRHVYTPTRGSNILDHVYMNIPSSYKALPCPHFGLSDHISLLLLPTYSQLIKRVKPSEKIVQVWTHGATSALQDCLSAQTGTCSETLPLRRTTSILRNIHHR